MLSRNDHGSVTVVTTSSSFLAKDLDAANVEQGSIVSVARDPDRVGLDIWSAALEDDPAVLVQAFTAVFQVAKMITVVQGDLQTVLLTLLAGQHSDLIHL